MEKYWVRLLLKWFIIVIQIVIQILAFKAVGALSLIALPFLVYNIVKILSYKVPK